jgi:hypothetical protein
VDSIATPGSIDESDYQAARSLPMWRDAAGIANR